MKNQFWLQGIVIRTRSDILFAVSYLITHLKHSSNHDLFISICIIFIHPNEERIQVICLIYLIKYNLVCHILVYVMMIVIVIVLGYYRDNDV